MSDSGARILQKNTPKNLGIPRTSIVLLMGLFILASSLLVGPQQADSAGSGLSGRIAFIRDDRLYVANIQDGNVVGEKPIDTGRYGCDGGYTGLRPSFDKNGRTLASYAYDKDKYAAGPQDGVHLRESSGVLFVDVDTGKLDWRPGLSRFNPQWISDDTVISSIPLGSDIFKYVRGTESSADIFLALPQGYQREDGHYYYSADPRSKRVLAAFVDSSNGGLNSKVFIKSLSGETTTIASDLTTNFESLTWCPEKNLAAYTINGEPDTVWYTSLSNWNPMPIDTHLSEPAFTVQSFTPDGSCLFLTNGGSSYDSPISTYIYHMDSGATELLSNDIPAMAWDPSYPGNSKRTGRADSEGKLTSNQSSCYGFKYGSGFTVDTRQVAYRAALTINSGGFDARSYYNARPGDAKGRMKNDSIFFFDGHGNVGRILFQEENGNETSLNGDYMIDYKDGRPSSIYIVEKKDGHWVVTDNYSTAD